MVVGDVRLASSEDDERGAGLREDRERECASCRRESEDRRQWQLVGTRGRASRVEGGAQIRSGTAQQRAQ